MTTVKLKPGDRVVMNNNYLVSEKNVGRIWTVASEPWKVCGSDVVKLEGFSSCYAVDGLDKVCKDRRCDDWKR